MILRNSMKQIKRIMKKFIIAKLTSMSTLTDRELLEQIYMLLVQIYNKVSEIDDDSKQFTMNVLANLVGDTLIQKQ